MFKIQLKLLFRVILITGAFSLITISCNFETPAAASIESLEHPTPEPLIIVTTESTVSDLIEELSSDNVETRLNAAFVLISIGPEAEPAIPALIENLNYQEAYEVRMTAAEALGAIGPAAKVAIPDLINLLQTDFVHVRRAAATALGQIKSPVAVPVLADALYDDDKGTAINAAKSLGIITRENFPELHSVGATLDENGIPVVVSAAREWWETYGQHQNWPDVP